MASGHQRRPAKFFRASQGLSFVGAFERSNELLKVRVLAKDIQIIVDHQAIRRKQLRQRSRSGSNPDDVLGHPCSLFPVRE
jgi:hypothetical protein